ncbi:MAG: DsbA family protein [Candidatus Saccharimonadales bacterium]
MDKRFLGIIVVIIIVIAGIVVFTNNNQKGNNGSGGKVGTLTQHIEGQGKAGIKLVEYGDYQCPYCGEYDPIVKQVASIYNQQITFQFRNYPLTEIHPNAFAGARAAEAAALQGKFWQMHDLLYQQSAEYYQSNEKLSNWVGASNPEPYFVQDAKQIGLNISQFKQAFSGNKVNNLINADKSEGDKLGVQGTPTFYLSGRAIKPNISLASFEKIINKAVKNKGLTPPAAANPAKAPSSSSKSLGAPQSTQPKSKK